MVTRALGDGYLKREGLSSQKSQYIVALYNTHNWALTFQNFSTNIRKTKALSMPPFKEHVPYITSKPKITRIGIFVYLFILVFVVSKSSSPASPASLKSLKQNE